MNKIKVELTEDQQTTIINALDFWVEKNPLVHIKNQEAFIKRLQTKLAKAKS